MRRAPSTTRYASGPPPRAGEELRLRVRGPKSATMTEAAIVIDQLSKTYAGGKQALDQVSY